MLARDRISNSKPRYILKANEDMRSTRREIMTTLLALGAGQSLYSSTLNEAAWRAYEAVEEAWIRDRHALLVDQSPECSGAAAIDLEIKLVELQRRGLQFQYLVKHSPQQLRGGMWQLSWIPISDASAAKLLALNPVYRRHEEKIRRLTEDLRKHPEYENFHRAQTRLWKTPEYHNSHRRYSARLQDLNRVYGGSAAGAP